MCICICYRNIISSFCKFSKLFFSVGNLMLVLLATFQNKYFATELENKPTRIQLIKIS